MLHLGPLPARLRRAFSERRKAAGRWMAWASQHRPPGPLVWLHAASVGETMAAVPVIERLRATLPDVIVIHTFTSPSMADWPVPSAVHRSDYAPQDSGKVLGAVFDALRPRVLVISRSDLWPGMAQCARRSGVPIAVVGGTIRPSSLRLRLPGRALLRRASRHLAFVGAVTKPDADRWRRFGVPTERVLVTGDPRDATILERPASVRTLTALAAWAHTRRVMVAGSTHPADERVIADTFEAVARHRPDVGLLVVPHDPSRLRPAWNKKGFAWSTWPGTGPIDHTPCIFAPVKGTLADLYLLAHVVYVGGGFDRGSHSVAEPAVYGLPVVTGPHARENPETHRFIDAGAVSILDEADFASEFERWWGHLLDDDAERWRIGLRGREVMDSSAARISAEAVRGLMDLG